MSLPPTPEWLLLAHILRPQGRKGEVLADLFTDFPDRFAETPSVFLAKPRFSGPAHQATAATVSSYFLPLGRNQGRIVLQFAGIDSISQAESLAGLEVIVPQQQRRESEDDASYISDLLGCSVYDLAQDSADPTFPGLLVGIVDDVHFPTSPDGTRRLSEAAPLLSVLSPTGAEILIPYVKAFLTHLDLDRKRLLMTLPPGLLEVNA